MLTWFVRLGWRAHHGKDDVFATGSNFHHTSNWVRFLIHGILKCAYRVMKVFSLGMDRPRDQQAVECATKPQNMDQPRNLSGKRLFRSSKHGLGIFHCYVYLFYQESAPNILYYTIPYFCLFGPPCFCLVCMFIPRKNNKTATWPSPFTVERFRHPGHPVLDFRRFLPSGYQAPAEDGTGAQARQQRAGGFVYQNGLFEPKNSISFCQRFEVATFCPLYIFGNHATDGTKGI